MNPLIDHTMSWVRSQLPEPGGRALTDQDRADVSLAVRVLRGSDGPAFLELLARSTVLRPPTDARLTGPASHDYAQRRTGENSVFGVLVHLLDTHDHLERKKNAPENPDPSAVEPVFGWRDDPFTASYGHAGDGGFGDAGGRDAAGRDTGPGISFDPGGTIAAG